MRTYDFKKNKLIIGGLPIQGFADGTGINFSRQEDLFSDVSGADGEMSRAKSNNRSGMLTITLSQTSPSNDYLSFLHNQDETNNTGIRAALLKDFGGTSQVSSPAVYVKKFADIELGKEITGREWSILCADTKVNVGGNANAIIT